MKTANEPAAVPANAPSPGDTVRPPRAAKTAGIIEPLKLSHELRDFDRFPVSTLLKAARPAVYEQCVEIMRRARAFSTRHVVDRAAAWDAQAGRDHGFVPWPAIDAGLPYGFLSMNVPGVLGGGNFGPTAAGVFAEEIAAADAGMYVIYGAHALALALVLASLDLPLMARVGREISEGEKQGKAVVLALAHTEPGGGSDVEDVGDMRHGRFGSRYEKVAGGYKVNARKVFISNGSIARYQVLTAFGDLKRPLETMRAFLVASESPGFTVGRCERKLGQRLSTAVEVICDDVFVPDAAAIDLGDGARAVDTTLSLTRGPVGAMSTGIIRGTLERTLAYLSQKRVGGRWLFEEQWIQLALADMLGALQASRGLYMDSSIAAEAWGYARILDFTPKNVPVAIRDNALYEGVMKLPAMTERARALYASQTPTETVQRLVSHASMAKFVCSDNAVAVTMKAIEILGEDANDPAWGVEKAMRDAKLAQIFEGTNQINRLHVARGLLKRA